MGGLRWAAIQDWMCEPFVLKATSLVERTRGDAAAIARIARRAGVAPSLMAVANLVHLTPKQTAERIELHQRRTVESWVTLNRLAPDLPWIPVLQGWESDDYRRHVDMYQSAGTDLRDLPLVGIGSVCRRQGTREAERIVRRISQLGISLHLFGFKTSGLRRCAHLATSADSLAWSYAGRSIWRRETRRACGGDHRGGCGNCATWAVRWREQVLAAIPTPGRTLFA